MTNWTLPPQMEAQLAVMNKGEKVMEEKLDAVSNKLAQRVGYESVPWFKLTWFLLWIYTGLTMFVLFSRSDFINLTVCTVAIFMMFHTERITRTRFRMLVLGIFMTLIYDMVWFTIKSREYQEDLKTDGGMERGVRTFSLWMSYVSFIVRVSLRFVLIY